MTTPQPAALAPVTVEHDGDPPAAPADFDSFYRSAYPRLAAALAVTLSDADLGREAADEAMARAYERWDRVAGYDNPGGWTYRVGLNWARSVHRRLRRALPVPARPERVELHIPDPDVHAAIADLAVDQRAVVVCRLLLDWSVDDTAAALKIRPGTVKSRLHRALATLERRLEDHR